MRKKEMFKYGLGNPMNVIEEDFVEEDLSKIIHSKDPRHIDTCGIEYPITVERWWVNNKLFELFKFYLSQPMVIEKIRNHKDDEWFGNNDSPTFDVLLDLLNLVNEVLCEDDGFLPSEHFGYTNTDTMEELKENGDEKYKDMDFEDMSYVVQESIRKVQGEELNNELV